MARVRLAEVADRQPVQMVTTGTDLVTNLLVQLEKGGVREGEGERGLPCTGRRGHLRRIG